MYLTPKNTFRWFTPACLLGLLVTVTSAFAGIIVTQNVSPGATSWPGIPLVGTVSNPNTQAGVAESFGAGVTNYTQTFTIGGPNNYIHCRPSVSTLAAAMEPLRQAPLRSISTTSVRKLPRTPIPTRPV
jgi:hypothetical protein